MTHTCHLVAFRERGKGGVYLAESGLPDVGCEWWMMLNLAPLGPNSPIPDTMSPRSRASSRDDEASSVVASRTATSTAPTPEHDSTAAAGEPPSGCLEAVAAAAERAGTKLKKKTQQFWHRRPELALARAKRRRGRRKRETP